MIETERSAVRFGHTTIEYAVRRTARCKTVSVALDPADGVIVTAPAGTPLPRLDAIVYRKATWIVERLRRRRELPAPLPTREFVSGESYLYLGRQYRLKVQAGNEPGVKLLGGWLVATVAPGQRGAQRAAAVRAALVAWYRRHAARRLPERVAYWAGRAGVPEPAVLIRDQRKRWASCDAQGTLRFNWRVIQAPMWLVDYVVAHEVVHLLRRDHDESFWQRLARLLPDYEVRRVGLIEQGARLGW